MAAAALAAAGPAAVVVARQELPEICLDLTAPVDPLPVDAGLNFTATAGVEFVEGPLTASDGRQIEVAHMRWDPGLARSGAECVRVWVRAPGAPEYPGASEASAASWLGDSIQQPRGTPGEYCYRLVALSPTARSEPVELCVVIAAPQPTPEVFEVAEPGDLQVTPLMPDSGGGGRWRFWPLAAGLALGAAVATLLLTVPLRRRGG